MTPFERAATIEMPWMSLASRLDEPELRRRIAAAIEAAVAEERAACLRAVEDCRPRVSAFVSDVLDDAWKAIYARGAEEKGDAKPTDTATARSVPGA